MTKEKKHKLVQQEEEVLKFWQQKKIFEKSVDKKAPKGPIRQAQGKDYVFYDGPPFATGEPHYGHIVASLMKDVVPRFWTMNGYRVERVWGWDCHGLPIENIVEKELKIKSKKEIIEKVGVEKFNESCRSKVLMYADVWKKFIPRMGRWVDMDNAYKTMDLDYMESIWWVFKQLWDKGLIYEGHKSMHICPRCETTLSQSEVTQGYKDIEDISVTVKFQLTDEPDTYMLAWTTTPWTLPGNVALAVNSDIDYVKVNAFKKRNELGKVEYSLYILSKDIYEKCSSSNEPTFLDQLFLKSWSTKEGAEFAGIPIVIDEFKGSKLIGKSYKPLFPYFDQPENRTKGFKIYSGDFVSTEEGTGVVHIAPAFGEDDLHLGKKEGLPFIQHVDFSGHFTKEVKDFAGLEVKPAKDPQATDRIIVDWLAKQGKLFSQEEYTHSYPHCWRCDTPLLNYATSSLFVNVTKIKPQMTKLVKKINWVPAHIKDGRFGKWLEGAQDWSISRQRFWGSVIPIWECDRCQEQQIFGSIKELEEASGVKVTDLHKHVVDKITFKCQKCKGTMKRVPDVLDCWFESGSMPYAQWHYPFANKQKFESNFPAEYIAEGVDQCRCWFYYLLVLSTAIMNDIAFKNVIANGIVLAEDGQKMSKHLKNYPDPNEVINKYGADALRYYLLTAPVMKAETLCFSEKGVDEAFKKVILLLWNVFTFYQTYAQEQKVEAKTESKNLLDRWIISKAQLLLSEVTKQMQAYDLVLATRPIQEFIGQLSTWYLRRSRDRFKSQVTADKQAALQTTKSVLLILSQILAPFIPFIAEKIYQSLKTKKDPESVHLCSWPNVKQKLIDQELGNQMSQVLQVVEQAHALRATQGFKVRQPLSQLAVQGIKLTRELQQLIQDEVNVLAVRVVDKLPRGQGWVSQTEATIKVALNTELTEELKLAGFLREIIRQVNALRKEAGLTVKDKIVLSYNTDSQLLKKLLTSEEKQLKNKVLADNLEQQSNVQNFSYKKELTFNKDEKLIVGFESK